MFEEEKYFMDDAKLINILPNEISKLCLVLNIYDKFNIAEILEISDFAKYLSENINTVNTNLMNKY